jgi:hypothetical protein
MASKRNRTREKLLERIRQLKLAREAFQEVWAHLPGGSTEEMKQYQFNRGFDWAMNKLKEIA